MEEKKKTIGRNLVRYSLLKLEVSRSGFSDLQYSESTKEKKKHNEDL